MEASVPDLRNRVRNIMSPISMKSTNPGASDAVRHRCSPPDASHIDEGCERRGRGAEPPRGCAQACHQRTTLYILLPSPYCGSPLQSVQALPSTFFSLLKERVAESPRGRAHARHPRTTSSFLLPTLEAHCKSVQALPSTFFSLLPTFPIRGPHSPLSPPTTYQRHNARLPAIHPTVNLQYAHAARHDAPRGEKEVDRRCQSTQPHRVIPLYTPQERRCRSRKQ